MLSMFTVTGQVMKTFIQEGKTDKQTGEIDESSIKVQILGEMPVKGGDSRLDLITLTVENEKTYSDLTGKRIRVPLGFFAPSKGQIIYFIPKGSKPELLSAQNG
jgi:hypothetical protein